jgi:uncharacterized protein YoxC
VSPLIWLGISLTLLAVSLSLVVAMAFPVMRELSRAARSAEKLFDTLAHELPPTLKSLQSTGQDLGQLSQQVEEGVRHASQVVQQVDESLDTLRHQASTARHTAHQASRALAAGARAAWTVLSRPTDRQ